LSVIISPSVLIGVPCARSNQMKKVGSEVEKEKP